MKKSVMFLAILLFLFPILTAVEFDMKTEFGKGETLSAKISGNFIDSILPENVFFYRGNVRVPFLYDVAKIQDEFYVYALLSETEGNYSISIKNVQYIQGSKVTDKEIKKDFAISNKTADFSINPGFVLTKKDFFIKVQNLQDAKINVNVDDGREITLKSGEIKKIDFNVKSILQNISETFFKKIKLSSSNTEYEIPTYILTIDYLENETQNKTEFRFSPVELNISMTTNSNKTKIIYIYNTGQTELNNISLSVSKALDEYISLSAGEIEKLTEGSNIKIELYVNSLDYEDYIEGYIKAKTKDGDTAYIGVILNFLKDYVPLTDAEEDDYIPDFVVSKTCSQMEGKICIEDEECDGPSSEATDGVCCLGICREKKKSPVGKIIGFAIAIILIILIYWFLIKKYKGAKRNVDLISVARGKR